MLGLCLTWLLGFGSAEKYITYGVDKVKIDQGSNLEVTPLKMCAYVKSQEKLKNVGVENTIKYYGKKCWKYFQMSCNDICEIRKYEK